MYFLVKMAGIKKEKDYLYQIVDERQLLSLKKNKKLIIKVVGELCLK